MNLLNKRLGQNTFGFLFADNTTDREPLVIFPGESYLKAITQMGINWGAIAEADGGRETILIPDSMLSDSIDYGVLPYEIRAHLAQLLSQIFVAGMLVERACPRRYATNFCAGDYRDPDTP